MGVGGGEATSTTGTMKPLMKSLRAQRQRAASYVGPLRWVSIISFQREKAAAAALPRTTESSHIFSAFPFLMRYQKCIKRHRETGIRLQWFSCAHSSLTSRYHHEGDGNRQSGRKFFFTNFCLTKIQQKTEDYVIFYKLHRRPCCCWLPSSTVRACRPIGELLR